LSEIARFLAQQAGVEAALRFYDKAEAGFLFLSRNPGIGRRRSFRRRALQGVRSWSVPGFRNWLVFYRADGDTVEVLRVLHGARNLNRIFKDEEK